MALSDSADPEPSSRAPHPSPEALAPSDRQRPSTPVLARVFAALAFVVTLAASVLLVWQIAAARGPETGTFLPPEAYPPAEPGLVLTALDGAAPVPDLAATVTDMLNDSRYDGEVSAVFTDVLTGEVLYERNGGTPRVPASSLKLLTAIAAFEHLGPEYRFPTTVVDGPDADTIVLVGGGDVTLTVDGKGYFRGEGASLTELADLVLEARGGDAPSTVLLDTSLFSDDRRAPGTVEDDFSGGATAEMTPLMVDAGRIDNTTNQTSRHADPAMDAAETFADLLGASTVERGTAAEGAAEIAVVHSAPIARLADEFVMRSDNTLTDAVGLRVGLAVHGEMTWKAATDALVSTLEDLGVDTAGVTLSDTSGLSKDNRMTANAFAQMLTAAATDDEAGAVFATLPVAGHSGTLRDRFFTATDGYGIVRAKTGALTGVSSLTGSVVTEDGRQIVFSLISNGHSNNYDLQTALDETATAVAGCGC